MWQSKWNGSTATYVPMGPRFNKLQKFLNPVGVDLRVAAEDPVEIDGHDFGKCEFNIFKHTGEPTETLGQS